MLFFSLQRALLPQGDGVHGDKISWVNSLSMQFINGSPVYPGRHIQFGVWLTTLHCAFEPHAPWHGSAHLFLMQAMWFGHSLLLVHSGLQFGGTPINSGIQEQEGESLILWQIELGPHGDGSQGLIWGGDSRAKINNNTYCIKWSHYVKMTNIKKKTYVLEYIY